MDGIAGLLVGHSTTFNPHWIATEFHVDIHVALGRNSFGDHLLFSVATNRSEFSPIQ